MIDLSKYHLKQKYRKVLEHLSDDDKIRIAIENYDIAEIKDIVIYYDLQDNPLLRTLGLEKYGKDPRWAYWYALEVIKGRWPEAEEYIKKDPEIASYYAEHVMKDRNFWDNN